MMKKVSSFMKKNALMIVVLLVVVAVVVYFLLKNKMIKVVSVKDHAEKPEEHKSSEAVCVFFHMNGCGHCEAMKPEWQKLSEMKEYKGCKFVDHESKDEDIMNKHQIQGFPTIKFCPEGIHNVEKCIVYEGERTADAIIKFLDKHI